MMKIHELKYSNTNTYLIESDKGKLLFDTGWAGTFAAFCREMGKLNIPVQEIDHILISHFHPDHMGIAQEIADLGPVIVVADVQWGYMHNADSVFVKEKNRWFKPVEDAKVKILDIRDSREFLREIGISGEILYTPGHSDDSISLSLDDGSLFVGDLNPLYELELHKGTRIEESWKKLLLLNPRVIYYGHAKKTQIGPQCQSPSPTPSSLLSPSPSLSPSPTPSSLLSLSSSLTKSSSPSRSEDHYELVSKIMKLIDKGMNLDKIAKKTGADKVFAEDVARMYLTHQNISVQGILDRIEIKDR